MEKTWTNHGKKHGKTWKKTWKKHGNIMKKHEKMPWVSGRMSQDQHLPGAATEGRALGGEKLGDLGISRLATDTYIIY